MKIAYYCQHVLGIGHFHRSLEICRELAKRHQLTMITGGAPVKTTEKSFSFHQLPGLVMDAEFKNLTPCDKSQTLEKTKEIRAEKLRDFFRRFQPEVFLIELYPFGRKAFRFELDPVLEGIHHEKLCRCLTFCSVRDILVERHDGEKFENRVISTLNRFFNGVLVHGDKNFIPLQTTFSRVDDIAAPVVYTGYVTRQRHQQERSNIRSSLGFSPETLLIVASIGGGGVGIELLYALVEAMKHIENESVKLQIFTGPYASEEDFQNLADMSGNTISVDRFTTEFTCWLHAADLSVSMAGYNTTMNILAAGVPALLYPFAQNQEQRMRVERLEGKVPFKILEKAELQPRALAAHILRQLQEKRYSSPINLDGAVNTAAQIELWSAAMRS